jgi:GNAT superfamily N-acetyltransferase
MSLTLAHVARLADYKRVLDTRYGDNPSFVYPDIGFLSRVLANRSAFLDRGRAQAFAVRDGVRPKAFAVAFVDPGLQAKTGSPVGSIGFFEAVDQAGAAVVLNAACNWLSAQGVTEVWAPFNANPYYRMGTREDRFDEPPFVACAHDPPTTRSMLEANGFSRLTRYINFEIDLTGRPWKQVGEQVRRVDFRPMSRWRFHRDVLAFVHLHNAAFRTVWGEVEISEKEALQLLMRSRLALEPRLFQFAVIDDHPVGFVLCVANLGEVLAPLHQPLTSLRGVLRMRVRRRRATSVGLLAMAVAPEHQREGIGTALVARACRTAAELGFKCLEYALVAEQNEPSKATVARFGGRPCRTFGIYRRHLV